MYTIITKNEFGQWTETLAEAARYIGGRPIDNLFGTEEEAEQALNELLNVFRADNPDLSEDDFEVIRWDS